MNLISFAVSLILFACAGCGPRYSDFFLYNDDGTMKPKVAFLPVSASRTEVAETACYFDEAVRYFALDQGELYFYDKAEVENHCRTCQLDEPIKAPAAFLPAEYVVQLEVLQDEVMSPQKAGCTPLIEIPGGKPRNAIKIMLRLQVVDIRCAEPKVICYQILEKSQILTQKFNRDCVPGSLYEELAREVLIQIEDQIHCMR